MLRLSKHSRAEARACAEHRRRNLAPAIQHFTRVLGYLLLTALAATACADDTEVSDSRISTPISTPYVRSGLTPALVTRVVDGDTIRVEIDGVEYRLRYIGIDTPEAADPRRPIECFSREADERNRQLVEGKMVGLEKDVSETDEFGRLLRYVWVGDRLVNASLVEEGYAIAATFPPDVRYAEPFAALQEQARENRRGLWGSACVGETSPQGG